MAVAVGTGELVGAGVSVGVGVLACGVLEARGVEDCPGFSFGVGVLVMVGVNWDVAVGVVMISQLLVVWHLEQ